MPYSNQEEHVVQRMKLLQLLHEHELIYEGVRDNPKWEWDPKRVFSVKNAYYRLNNGGLRCSVPSII